MKTKVSKTKSAEAGTAKVARKHADIDERCCVCGTMTGLACPDCEGITPLCVNCKCPKCGTAQSCQHTPEPWTFKKVPMWAPTTPTDGIPVFEFCFTGGDEWMRKAKANSERAVLAVAACAGLENYMLRLFADYDGNIKGMLDNQAAEVARLREALNQSLIAMTTTRTVEGCSPFMADAIEAARAALAGKGAA